MYFILGISAVEMLVGIFLVEVDFEVSVLLFFCWLTFFAGNLWKIFNLGERVFIIRMYVDEGINTDRKFALFLVATFGLILLPGALFHTWLTH
jgi:hypothetical protein